MAIHLMRIHTVSNGYKWNEIEIKRRHKADWIRKVIEIYLKSNVEYRKKKKLIVFDKIKIGIILNSKDCGSFNFNSIKIYSIRNWKKNGTTTKYGLNIQFDLGLLQVQFGC